MGGPRLTLAVFQQSQSPRRFPYFSKSWGISPTVSPESIAFPFGPWAQRVEFLPCVWHITSVVAARPRSCFHVCLYSHVCILFYSHVPSFHIQPFGVPNVYLLVSCVFLQNDYYCLGTI